jgi:hypothetical protein
VSDHSPLPASQDSFSESVVNFLSKKGLSVKKLIFLTFSLSSFIVSLSFAMNNQSSQASNGGQQQPAQPPYYCSTCQVRYGEESVFYDEAGRKQHAGWCNPKAAKAKICCDR